MADTYNFHPDSQLPLAAIAGGWKRFLGLGETLDAEQKEMLRCYESLPEKWKAIVLQGAQRDRVIMGRDLLNAERNAKMEQAGPRSEMSYDELRHGMFDAGKDIWNS